jgi:hypothetical protein
MNIIYLIIAIFEYRFDFRMSGNPHNAEIAGPVTFRETRLACPGFL